MKDHFLFSLRLRAAAALPPAFFRLPLPPSVLDVPSLSLAPGVESGDEAALPVLCARSSAARERRRPAFDVSTELEAPGPEGTSSDTSTSSAGTRMSSTTSSFGPPVILYTALRARFAGQVRRSEGGVASSESGWRVPSSWG